MRAERLHRYDSLDAIDSLCVGSAIVCRGVGVITIYKYLVYVYTSE